MHLENETLSRDYTGYIRRKKQFITWTGLALALAAAMGLCLGAVPISPDRLLSTLAGAPASRQEELIVWQIRLPQILAALAAGAGLAGAGVVMQSVLKNPLASPFTLGVAHAAAFGAAFSVVFLAPLSQELTQGMGLSISPGTLTLVTAFGFAMATALVITLMAQLRTISPQVMVLTGVALGSLFTAGTMLLQYFADDVQLAAMVFWTFGDVGRVQW
ncbi:MAG: iron ABC transporter permease, partial [Desulfobacterales bacterium]|nr:iron ABC transporter permease [Desulfobacterales bacterium]